MSDELKPCAHCGGGHVVEEWRREDDRTDYWTMTLWRVTCGGCGMSTDWHASREAALDVWNKRADEFGADDDYERRMDELLCRLTNGKWSKSRSYSVDFMVSCVDEAYDEILDPPAESHYAPRNTRADDAPETTVDNAQADSREKLEADIWDFIEHKGWFGYEYEAKSYADCRKAIFGIFKEWLDRKAAITAEETSNAWEEYRDATQREIDELTAERDELRDIIDHMPKTEQECEACQEAHDRLMFNAKVDMDKLRDELKHKQHVCDVQRDSFLKMEREYRELQDVCGELERTIENMRGD